MKNTTKNYYIKNIKREHPEIDAKLLDTVLNQLTRLHGFEEYCVTYDNTNLYTQKGSERNEKRREHLKTLLLNNAKKIDKNAFIDYAGHLAHLNIFNYDILD